MLAEIDRRKLFPELYAKKAPTLHWIVGSIGFEVLVGFYLHQRFLHRLGQLLRRNGQAARTAIIGECVYLPLPHRVAAACSEGG
jgi:hypothetical protein